MAAVAVDEANIELSFPIEAKMKLAVDEAKMEFVFSIEAKLERSLLIETLNFVFDNVPKKTQLLNYSKHYLQNNIYVFARHLLFRQGVNPRRYSFNVVRRFLVLSVVSASILNVQQLRPSTMLTMFTKSDAHTILIRNGDIDRFGLDRTFATAI